MKISDILSIILVGLVIGVLGRLVLPGRQRLGAFATFVVGMVAAAVGFFVMRAWGAEHHAPAHLWRIHWDWLVLLVQVVLAVIGVAIANAMTYTRLADGGSTRRPAARRKRSRA
jgi:uncharacterized membrane protein YeaQ/YmgE (transglycosylase-associated protein family)